MEAAREDSSSCSSFGGLVSPNQFDHKIITLNRMARGDVSLGGEEGYHVIDSWEYGIERYYLLERRISH